MTKATIISEAAEVASELVPAPDYRKVIGWKGVCQVANRLTNFMTEEAEEASKTSVLVSSGWPGGVYREVHLSGGGNPKFFPAYDLQTMGWTALQEEEASFILWRSGSSGCELEAVRLGTDRWELTFSPAPTNPEYRGQYFHIWEKA